MKKIEATLCIPIREHEILLGLKKTKWGKGYYNGFGGKVHARESIEHRALLELKEEAGLTGSSLDLTKMAELSLTYPKVQWVVYVYTLTAWRGEPTESREMKPKWFSREAIPYERMWQDDILWLSRVLEGEKVRGTFTFGKDEKTMIASRVVKVTSFSS